MDPLQRALADMKSSTRKGDRKNGAQNLVDCLDTDEMCDKLDLNSVSQDKKGCEKMTWTRLFIEVRDYFKKQTEKGQITNKLQLFGVVKSVFTKATRSEDRPWLHWSKVYDFITVHLREERSASVFGPPLINMLETFLSIKFYRTVMDAASWIDLIKILTSSYGKYSISTSSILSCLNICILQGSLYDGVISLLRTDVVDFYIKIVQQDRSVQSENMSVYLKGVTTLSTQNANEFRGILCKLGELVLPAILHVRAFTEDQEIALLEFLLVQYRLHMPYNIEIASNAFHADDTAKWKEILRQSYSYCIDTIEEIATKRTSHNKSDLRARDDLLLLAAKCTKQISSPSLLESYCSDEEDIDGENHSKKKMRYKSFHTIISDIYSKPPSEGLMTWLSYLTVVLNDFPELVGTRINYSNLIHLGSSLFNTKYTLRKEFYSYFMSLIRAEKSLRSQGKIDDVTDTWTTLWDLTIKSVPVCDDKEVAVNLLRQILKDMNPTNVTSLLILYINGSMPLLKCSIQLLQEYLTLCSLPVQINCSTVRGSQSELVDEQFAVTPCPRSELLKWLVKVVNNEDVSGFESLIATVMCALVVKQSHVLLQENVEPNLDRENNTPSFEKLLTKSCFTQLGDEAHVINSTPSGSHIDFSTFSFVVEQRPAERLMLALQADFDNIAKLSVNVTRLDQLNPYKKLVARVNLCLNLLNVIEKNLVGDSSLSGHLGFKSTLERICDSGLSACNKFITDMFASTNRFSKTPGCIEKIIKFTRLLFSTESLCDNLRSFISQRFTPPTLELFKRYFRSNLAVYIERALNNSHESSLVILDPDFHNRIRLMQIPNATELALITRTDRSYEKMSLEALNILIDYGLICEHKLDFFEELMKDLNTESYYSTNQFLFDAVTSLISKLATILKAPELHNLIVEDFGVMILLQKCCRVYSQLPPCAEQLWILFKEVIPAIECIDGRGRQNFMVLVGTLYHILRGASKVPRFVYEKTFATLTELSKIDRNLTWTVFNPMKSPAFWVLEDVKEFLARKSHQTRMQAAFTICQIYEHAAPYDYSEGVMSSQSDLPTGNDDYQERRKSFLDALFQNLISAFEIDGGLTGAETLEESINRTTLVLSCLTRLIFAFPYTQKQTIMFLFSIIKLKKIDVGITQRALQYVSSNSTKTMCCYFPYVLKKMLKLKNSIEDLPHRLFGCDNFIAFASKFRNEICVEYFEQDKMVELEAFAKHFNLTPQRLIQDCYGLIMAKITPGLAIHSYALNARGVNLAVNNDVHKRLISILGGKDVTDTLMATCLGDVVLNLISFTFEPLVMDKWNCAEVKLSEPFPPHHPQSTIQSCLQFLKAASPHSNLSVIGYLVKTSHQSIYKILLSLAMRIHEAHDELQKFWRLHQFTFFVDLLLNEPQETFNLMKEYVCSFVFNAYLRLLRLNDGFHPERRIRFLKVILRLVHNLVERLTSEYPAEMMIFYVSVIRSIVSASLKYPLLMESSKSILDFLLKTHGETFSTCIEALDPFPTNVLEFRDYHIIHNEKKYGSNRRLEWPLSKEFERLLEDNGTGVSKGSCTKESLQFLRELLSKRKRDLERMLKNLESKRFSEECVNDPVHHVIQMLISVTLDANQPQDVILEACKCLGEIGPVDLSILVLPPYKSQGKIYSVDDALSEIIKIIVGYQTCDDIKIVNVSGKVLRTICQFEQCSLVVNVDLKDSRLSKVMLPFLGKQSERKRSDEKVDTNLLETNLGMNEMNEGIEYKTWLTKLTTGIIESFQSRSSLVAKFLPLCELRADFCEDVFPYVVHLCLFGGKSNPLVKKTLTGYFRTFFSKFVSNYNSATETGRSFTPSSSGTSSTIIYMNKLALRLLIRVVQFLRRHPLPSEVKGNLKLTPWDDNFWLDINYLDVARAAQYCGAYLTSVLYIEIAATQMDMSNTGTQSQYSSEYDDDSSQDDSLSQAVAMYPRNKIEASKIQKLLLKAYSSIGEVDAAYGCGSARFADAQSSMHHLEQSMDWHRLLMLANGSSITSDAQDNLQSCSDQHVALSLKQLGLHNVLWTFLKGAEAMGNVLPEDLLQVQYECGWRLSKWDLKNEKPAYIKDITESNGSLLGFQRCIYDGIHSGLSNDKNSQLKSVNDGFRSVYTELRHATLESSENIYGFLSRFQMLRVVEDFFDDNEDVKNLVRKWKQHDRVPIGDFKHHEPVLSLRNVLLRAYDRKNHRANLDQEINDSLLDLIAKARNAGRLDLAESCATAMNSVGSKPSTSLELEIAKNHWTRGKTDIARDIMSKLIRKSSHEDDLYPTLLLVYGDWLSISHCERPAVILKDYLQRSCTIYEKRVNSPQSDLSKAYIVLAKYADAQYQNVTKYIASDVFQSKVNHLHRARIDEQRLQNSVDKESKQSVVISKRNSSFDITEINYIHKEQRSFLELALTHYLKGLKTSNDNDLLIFRAISLWLENGSDVDVELLENVTRIFNEEVLPSYKYIVVLHQLSARLSSTSTRKNEVLRDILLKCAIEHPYHTIPILMTQASLHKDDEALPPKNSSLKVQLADRVKAAAEIINSLRAQPVLKNLVGRMESLWLALIRLANIPDGTKNVEGVKKNIPNEVMKCLANLESIAVPTSGIPVLPTANYKDCVIGISRFGSTYGFVGGINSPKKLACVGTNGLTYNMLLKGHDDLRQDAVMQQVFAVMNNLLQAEPKTKLRRLHIRTYKVIPLSQRTGLIEWVEDTQTFGEYLVGNQASTSGRDAGAHVRYRPTDYKPIECRKLLQDARANPADLERKHSTYIRICEHFKPVFRHFFFENFKEAGVFFEKRLAYTRSVATTSIVGYILGLGDRHVLNILIDKKTAEFIHIDLGVAFEQGRILPTPETIPFRLTRDVIDGMGVSGVDGVFKKSCEETMDLLRKNSEIIITVLQVLLYDPLYMWALTNDRVAKVQPSDSSKAGRKSKTTVEPPEDSVKERNNSASRVLLRLRQKLMGIEEEGGATGALSSGSSLSVDGHVSLLIQRAADPDKLCRLFPGWQPYL